LKWKSTGILVAPQNDATHFLYSVKDPTIFRYKNKWEVYATEFAVRDRHDDFPPHDLALKMNTGVAFAGAVC
jgi:hypothetical protein